MENPFTEIMNQLADIKAELAAIKLAQAKQKPVEKQDEFKTAKETQRLLRVSANTLAARTREGKIKSYRFGRNIRYKMRDIEAALKLRDFGAN